MWQRQALLVLLGLLLSLLPVRAIAAEIRQGDSVVVGPNDMVSDDLYAFGGSVDIRGTVKGDVVAFGGTITISGTVTGDVIACGGATTISGKVGNSVRTCGGSVTISGAVAGDVLFGGGSLTVGPSATIGRDLLAGGGSATVQGPIGRNVLAGAGDLTLASAVGGDVRAEVSTLRLADSAAIAGNIVYTSDHEAAIASGAKVQGSVERHQRERRAANAIDPVIAWLRMLVGTFALGLLFMLLWPSFSQRAAGTIEDAPVVSGAIGCALLLGVPVVALAVFVVGLLVGGWWLALMALALYAIALAVSFVVSGSFVGKWILVRAGRPELHFLWALLLGLVILLLAGQVPWVGGIISVLAVIFGLGALALAVGRGRRATQAPG